jgi:hypothetical protein
MPPYRAGSQTPLRVSRRSSIVAQPLPTGVGKDLGLRWHARSALGDAVQLVWHTRIPVSDSVDIRWNARRVVYAPALVYEDAEGELYLVV